MKIPENNYLFHVHTCRCKHAFDGINDEEVIEEAKSQLLARVLGESLRGRQSNHRL